MENLISDQIDNGLLQQEIQYAMSKLTIFDIAKYLPYGLMGYFGNNPVADIVSECDFANNLITGLNCGTVEIECFKPILHSLSTVFEDLEFQLQFFGNFLDERFKLKYGINPVHGLLFVQENSIMIQRGLPLSFYEQLNRKHIDTNGLIHKGLAIAKY